MSDMPGSGEEYLISRKKKIERRQKIVTIVSLVSFVGSTLFGVISAVQQASQPKPAIASPSAESVLQQQARGYELVLQREPENPTALEELVNVRLKLKDTQAAIQPLEKLVKLRPDRPNYKVILEELKKKQVNSNSQINNHSKPN